MDKIEPEILKVEEAHQAFLKKFAELRQVFFEEGQRPSPNEGRELIDLFLKAFPIKSEYLDYIFLESKALAQDFSIDLPRLPDVNIFDLRYEPIAGMGYDLFSRLIYLENLARDVKNHINETIKVPTSNTPLTQLVTAGDVFRVLKEEGMAIIARETNPDTRKPNRLRALFQPLQPELSGTGTVIEISKISTVKEGTKTFAHVNLDGNFVELELRLPEKDIVQIGDVIGAGGVKILSKTTRLASAQQVNVVAPKAIMGFLKHVEPDFLSTLGIDKNIEYESIPPDSEPDAKPKIKKVEILTNENRGTLILGRIIDIQNHGLKIIIEDKDGNDVPVDLTKSITYFHLKKGDTFLALPSRLGDDGAYTIEPQNVFKLSSLHASRIMSGLTTKPNKENYKGFEEFQQTDVMPR